ncbi:protein kinase domain-containing protein [Ditylenchus destructor]|nr:protein kinase domain-containing protein [Ditylenchus destructor]
MEKNQDFQDFKVKIFFNRKTLVVYLSEAINLETFYSKIREACKLTSNQPITVKWIDNEDDPCTIASQMELTEAIRLTYELKDVELKVHVFLGVPMAPGAPCPGEDKTVYRRGARRWKKFYHVKGHTFQPKRLNQRTECALCLDTIWGLGRAGFRCLDCGMCVHKKCHKYVSTACTNERQVEVPQMMTQAVAVRRAYQEVPWGSVHGSVNGEVIENRVELQKPDRGDGQNGRNGSLADDSGRWSIGLDDFELLTVIGRGSYAKVVQAEHKKTGQIYAIKIIKKALCTDEEDIDWIQTEKSVFETASNHPFLVGLHSCFQSDSRLFFVIEFIPGGDLMFHMQKQQKLPEDHAR